MSKLRWRYRGKISWEKLYGNWYLGAYIHQLMQTLQIHLMLGHRLLTVFLYKKQLIESQLEGQVCSFCGKPGDEEKPLKFWTSTYNDTKWFYHDPCLWAEMDRDERE